MSFDRLKVFALMLCCLFSQQSRAQNPDDPQWLDLKEYHPHEQFITHFGTLKYPPLTMLELPDQQLAVIIATQVPDISSRHENRPDDLRVVFVAKTNQRVPAKFDGESLGRSGQSWISSVTYLPVTPLAKKDTLKIILQGRATPERLAQQMLEQQQEQERNQKVDQLISTIPFPPFVVGEKYEVVLTQIDGQPYQLKQDLGKVVLIDFYGAWCSPCQKAWPKLRALRAKYSADEFQILGVSLEDSQATVETLIKKEQLNWPQVIFEEQLVLEALFKKLGFSGVPYYLLIDQRGIVVAKAKAEDLEQKIQKLLPAKVIKKD
ncbi:MAG: TlpA family protein disulfide reductase [Gammaproteobacteria bacterium]|nr:TlpA family protein disulfide reductase [Gammaproteobacteria bacterium]